MWSVYGHKGIAVRSSVDALRLSLPQNRSFQITRMRYVDRRPCSEKAFDTEGRDRHLVLRPHLLKAIEYQHEREIRIITECPAKCDGVLVDGLNWRSLIQKITISPLLPAQEAKAIETMLRKYFRRRRITIERSKLLTDTSMDANDNLHEAIRQDNGGCYEQGLPVALAGL